MLRLYKTIDHQLHYWKSEDIDNETTLIQWGIVGQRGLEREITLDLFPNFRKVVQHEVDTKINEGYAEMEDEQWAFLDVMFAVDELGTEQDLDKRYRLYYLLEEVLESTGLGYVDGAGAGGGAMGVFCEVVDVEMAKHAIEERLSGTEFDDHAWFSQLEQA